MAEQKPRRRPDGTLEYRGLDDILKEAVESSDYEHLPGKGRPLNLEDYFAAEPENRAAYRLLRDNKILPQHIQDLQDAQTLKQAAEALRTREEPELLALRREIRTAAGPLCAPFPDRRSLMDCLELGEWPELFPEPAGVPCPDIPEWAQHADTISRLTRRYNYRAATLTAQYLRLLSEARDRIRSFNTRIALSGIPAIASPTPPTIDLAAEESAIRDAAPPLEALPENASGRVRAYALRTHPSLLQRLLRHLLD